MIRWARHGAVPMVLAGLLAAAAPAAQAARPGTSDILQLRAGISSAEGRSLVQAAGGRVTGVLPIIHGLAVRLPDRARVALRADRRVVSLSPNAGVRSQSDGPDSSRLDSTYPLTVRAPSAWQWEGATGAGVGVAVIDTGIDGDLPDFRGDDGRSRVVASAVTNPDATSAEDAYGHGTHVAGIIAGDGTRRAANDPADGHYVGVAPDANLISIKASADQGAATVLDAIYGLQFAVDHRDDYNIRVVNLSLSSTVSESYRTDPLDAAVEAAYFKGIVVVAAAGNRGAAAGAIDYAPGNDPFALTVGAVDEHGTRWRWDDTFTDWSSTGTTQDGFDKPEVGAPGSHIVSTLAPGSAFADLCATCVVGDAYFRAGGTSMAAPVVTGVAALVAQEHPDWTPDEIKSTIVGTARPLPTGGLEVDAAAAAGQSNPDSGADAGIAPNDLIDPDDGSIDYARSSWGRSSWGAAPESLTAGWARSSWGCLCQAAPSDPTSTTRSSWGAFTWATRWGY